MQQRSARQLASDSALLVASVVGPAALYLGGLGFYSDDWHFLSVMTAAPDQSLFGLLRALAPDLLARPPHLFALVVLFQWFGLAALGYHVVSTLVLALGVVCFYLVLGQVGIARPLAVSSAVLYGTLPHYSTDRFWLASFQATLGMALFFAGTWALLRAARTKAAWPVSGFVAALLLAGSALSYEVFVPAVGIAAPIALLATWVDSRTRSDRSRRLWWLFAMSVTIAAAVVLFKLAASTRIPEFPSLFARVRWFAAVIRDGAALSYGEYGLGLPAVAVIALSRWPVGPRLLMGGAVSLLVAVYAYALSRGVNVSAPRRHQGRSLALIGPLLFLIGLAIFATNYAFLATPSGNANRIMIGAVAGVALTLIGLLAWALDQFPHGQVGRCVFASVVGALCFSGIVINATLADFWVSAAHEQARIVGTIRSALPTFPSGSTLLLYGFCPYHGPGIVFEAPWDLAGALQITYSDPTLRADVVSPQLSIGDDELTTEIYGVSSTYKYATLLLLDARDGAIGFVRDGQSFRNLVGERNPTCAGTAGAGAPVF
jgi:hypothetical protein